MFSLLRRQAFKTLKSSSSLTCPLLCLTKVYSSYFTQTADIMNIQEKQWGIGTPLQTSVLTSCICVITNNLLCVHIVMYGYSADENDGWFNVSAANEVTEILVNNNVNPTESYVCGGTPDFWGPGQPPGDGYSKLLENMGMNINEWPNLPRQKQPEIDDAKLKAIFDAGSPGLFYVEKVN